jgi:CRP-like cAMP-binding protein
MVSNDSGHLRNWLLARMPSAALGELARHLEIVPLVSRHVLFEAGKPLEHIYFPHSGLVCLMACMREGATETAAIGCEGFVGFEAVLGGESPANEALVQLAGTASRLPVAALRPAMLEYPQIRDLLLRYVRFFLIQALQAVACNTLHEVEERCAKWLLLAHDRDSKTDTFHLTQEFLAEILGVHRPSVTIVARTLQKAGLIQYSRGVIRITDRKGLEEAACECYRVVKRALDEILLPAS